MKPEHHKAIIVKINEIHKHPNADSLGIVHINGYQAVVKLGAFNVEDLGVYIFPDSVVPQTEPFKFIWENYQTEPKGEVPEKRRRITVRKFRGEWSEGLLLPVKDFPQLMGKKLFHSGGCMGNAYDDYYYIDENVPNVKEGDDVSDLLGITHYDPDAGTESTKGANTSGPRRRYPKTLRGWFFFLMYKFGFFKRQYNEEVSFKLPTYDVEALKNHKNAFQEGEMIVVTEKIHGSNARFVFIDGKMYAGSHYLWKAPNSNCVWRKCLAQNPWIEAWCRAHEGYALYGEITPTQKGFNYGCKEGEVRFFLFDIRVPEGKWPGTSRWASYGEGFELLKNIDYWVPLLNVMPFNLEEIKKLVDGPSIVSNAKHLREGIVIKPLKERSVPGLGRLQLKLVSNQFLEKDSK